MFEKNKVECVKDILKSCFLPELQHDLDSIPLQSVNFSEYQRELTANLPILYDFVQQHEQWIFLNDENDNQEIQACLIVLLCEVTGTQSAIYKLEDENLLKNANRLLRKYTQLNDKVEQAIFENYQNKLRKDCWKRQLGSVHGFQRYLEFRHNESTITLCEMSAKWLTFCLSVGLIIRESHEPAYKQMGIRIFQLMLHYGNFTDVQNLNINSVIYDAVFKDVYFMDSIVATVNIWNCLYKCLDYFHEIDSFTWSCVDDMMEILIRNISLATDSLISICMLKFITKLGYYFTLNRHYIEEKCNADLRIPAELDKFRNACGENCSYTIFRWAKSIMNMFLIESYKLMQSPNICSQFLQELHKCYIVCIWPISLNVIEPHLYTFYQKFTAVLMEVIVVQKRDSNIVKLVKGMFDTFSLQLGNYHGSNKNANLLKFREAYTKLLHHNLFVSIK